MLVHQGNLAYTIYMHAIDPKWSDLAAGYQSVRALQTRLENEFGRAFQTGYKLKYRQELIGWQKKRRVFIALAVLAPLSIITLCLAAFYFREAACVIVYWTVLVMIILVTLVVSGRNYINGVMNRPRLESVRTIPIDLLQRWWISLSPREQAIIKVEEKGNVDYLTFLTRNLPEACLVSHEPFLWILTFAGLWLFRIVPWDGMIVRQDNVWKQIKTVRDKMGRKQPQEQSLEPPPDEEWLRYKNELVNLVKERLPQQAWIASLVQGGLVFTHPGVSLDKPHIQGNTAAYGTLNAWIERLRRAPVAEGFTLDIQMAILDALHENRDAPVTSAKDEAEKLYQEAVTELRQSITNMVK
jgi:hypothetical protein